jgi:hypothetical protein
MLNLVKYIFLICVLFYASDSHAQLWPGGPVAPQDVIDDVGNVVGVGLEVENTTYFRLCEIRRFFCGKTKLVLLAAAIFTIGLLILIGRISWTQVLVVAIGYIIFSSAEYMAIQLTTLPPNLGVVYSCYCLDTLGGVISSVFN